MTSHASRKIVRVKGRRGVPVEDLDSEDPDLTVPFEGIGIDEWARAAALVARYAESPQEMAERHFHRVDEEFLDRMRRDMTGEISLQFARVFAETGGFETDEAEEGGDVLSRIDQEGYIENGDSGVEEEPLSEYEGGMDLERRRFDVEKFALISAAIGVWEKEGLDVEAMLEEEFNLDLRDWYGQDMFWSDKFESDPRLAEQYARLEKRFSALYRRRQAAAGASKTGKVKRKES
jgi:hypothetical protein